MPQLLGARTISYYQRELGDLHVIHCDQTDCQPTGVSTLASANDVGQYTSIAIGFNGFPIISSIDFTGATTNVARCANVACTTATSQSIGDANEIFQHTSIAIGIDGVPVVAARGSTGVRLTRLAPS